MSGFEYRRDIDGLRAVAVLAVVLFHAGWGFSGGFVGVDVFFVISGYLITSLILRRTEQGEFSLKDFWMRRIRRIAPALIVVVLAVMVISSTFMLPRDLEKVGKSSVAQAIAASNFYFWQDTGYFAGSAELKPLLHTWSLAVEEQFYLLLPLILIAYGRWQRRTLGIALAFVAAVSFAYSLHQVNVRVSTAFFLLPARAWELLAGSLLACLPVMSSVPRAVREGIAWSGLAAILIPCFVYDSSTLFPGLTALPPVLGAVLIILAGTGGETSLGRLLSHRVAVGIGLISYSLYLWHWPLFALSRYWMPELPNVIIALLIAASFILAYLSWKYVETPFRQRTYFAQDLRLLRNVVAVQVVIVAVGLSLDLLEGFPNTVSPQLAQLDAKNTWASVSNEDIVAGKLKPLGVADEEIRPTFLLWGDSHARAIAKFFDEAAKQHHLRGYAAISSNVQSKLIPRPSDETIQSRNDRIERLIYNQGIKHVFLVQRWESTYSYQSPDAEDFNDFTAREKKQMDRVLPELMCRLGEYGCQVHLLSQVPRQHGDDLFRQELFRQTKFPHSDAIIPKSIAEYEAEAFWLADLEELARQPHVHLLDIRHSCFNGAGESIVFVDGTSCYRDDDHLSDFGAEQLLTPVFAPILATIESGDDRTVPVNNPIQVAVQPDGRVVR